MNKVSTVWWISWVLFLSYLGFVCGPGVFSSCTLRMRFVFSSVFAFELLGVFHNNFPFPRSFFALRALYAFVFLGLCSIFFLFLFFRVACVRCVCPSGPVSHR